jgi:hypothetical protein
MFALTHYLIISLSFPPSLTPSLQSYIASDYTEGFYHPITGFFKMEWMLALFSKFLDPAGL